MIISLRLDDQQAGQIASLAKARGISKSELIRQCLDKYLASQQLTPTPTAWELGKQLFGCYDSGMGDLSVRAKGIARERAHAKRAKQA